MSKASVFRSFPVVPERLKLKTEHSEFALGWLWALPGCEQKALLFPQCVVPAVMVTVGLGGVCRAGCAQPRWVCSLLTGSACNHDCGCAPHATPDGCAFGSASVPGMGFSVACAFLGKEGPLAVGRRGSVPSDSPFTSAMFRPLPMLFFTLLMRLERKAESTSECRDALEMLTPVKLVG